MEAKDTRRFIDSSQARSLILDDLDLDPIVARRLSADVASRHHVLPVAARDRRVTVVMADPTDKAGLEAVTSELGMEPYVVQGDQTSIDRLLAQLWCEEGQDSPHLLVHARTDARLHAIRSYAEYIGDLLNAGIQYAPGEVAFDTLVEKASNSCDLVIVGESSKSFCQQLFCSLADRTAADRLPVSVLIARRPRHPLRRLLLVLQGNTSDGEATEWTLRLAGSTGASVTALAVVPPPPAMYRGLARMDKGLAELLTTDTILGRQLRQVARRLANAQIEGTLRLRQGSPEWEIRREVLEGRFDLLVIAAAPQDRMQPWALGDLAILLMRTVNRSILVTK